MLKRYLLCAGLLVLAGCTTKDSTYYRLHPKALEEAIKACPDESPAKVDCGKLALLATEVNQLGYAFQSNPQEFGHQIALMQGQLAVLQKLKSDDAAKAALKERLAQHLAIVRWLASPER